MSLGFNKWFSVLGLLIAIVISLGIGAYFNFSVLEGAESLESSEDTAAEEDKTETIGDETTGDETTGDETTGDSTSTRIRRRRRRKIEENNTDTPIESFSLIQNF